MDYSFDTFSLYELIWYGRLLYGKDVRNELEVPAFEALELAVREHCQAIRKHAVRTDGNLYSCGWLLDIARCIYTLRQGDIISKTAAGIWALEEGICPEEEQMLRAIQIRRSPLEYRDRSDVQDWLRSLGPSVQLFADVLERELEAVSFVKIC